MQVKVWPIHKHKWKVIGLLNNKDSYDFPYQGANLICTCGKFKIWKYKSYVWKFKELIILAEEKGWEIHAEVYNTR